MNDFGMTNPSGQGVPSNGQGINLGGAAGIGLGVADTVIGGIIQSAAAKKAYERQKELIADERRYNDPSMQMARLKAAGINPHMAYMKGTLNNVVSSSGKGVQMAKLPSPRLLESLATAQQIRNVSQGMRESKSREDLNRANADYRREEQGLLSGKKLGIDINNDIGRAKAEFASTREWKELLKVEAEIKRTEAATRQANSAAGLNRAKSKMEYLKMQEQRVINRYAERITRVRLDNMKLNRDYQAVITEYAQQGINFKNDTLVTRQIWEGLKKYGYDDYTVEAMLLKEGFSYVIEQAKSFIGLGSKLKAAQSLGGKLKSKTRVETKGQTKRGSTRTRTVETLDYH